MEAGLTDDLMSIADIEISTPKFKMRHYPKVRKWKARFGVLQKQAEEDLNRGLCAISSYRSDHLPSF